MLATHAFNYIIYFSQQAGTQIAVITRTFPAIEFHALTDWPAER